MRKLTRLEALDFAEYTFSIVTTDIDNLLKSVNAPRDRGEPLVRRLEDLTDEFISRVIEAIGVES